MNTIQKQANQIHLPHDISLAKGKSYSRESKIAMQAIGVVVNIVAKTVFAFLNIPTGGIPFIIGTLLLSCMAQHAFAAPASSSQQVSPQEETSRVRPSPSAPMLRETHEVTPLFSSEEDVQRAVNFLSSTTEEGGAGYVSTNPDLYGAFLPLSYNAGKRNGADYFGQYVTDELGMDPTVTDVYNPDDYTLMPQPGKGGDLQLERINVANGADIYDAATWQIALSLTDPQSELIASQNYLLSAHRDNPTRATTMPDGTFTYNGHSISDPNQAYNFRMVGKEWLSTDPFTGTEYEKYLSAQGLPDDNPEYQKGKVTWADWKPITGENAWAFLIGPLQSAYLREQKAGFVPFKSIEVQNAIGVLEAFKDMQSPLGGIYYATEGSLGNVGDKPINPYDVSVENNASLLSGLLILNETLHNTLNNDPTLSRHEQSEISQALEKIDGMLHGNKATQGLYAFFKNYAWDESEGAFIQGGLANDPSQQSDWVPTLHPRAVDVQTWTMTILGQRTVDEWHGFGAAYRAWEKTKEWGGFIGPDKTLWGVGFSDDQDEFKNSVFSAEWTLGAINLVRSLIDGYSQVDSLEANEFVQSLKEDEKSMVLHLQTLSTDAYSNTEAYESYRPSLYDSIVDLPKDKLAFLYANRRYFIPFGWNANPIPSTCATSWAIMMHKKYNPFKLGGGYEL